MKILVTGGAGFIGSHLVDRLVDERHDVRVLDNLEYQVHQNKSPTYTNKKAEYIYGDIRDEAILKKSLEGTEVIFHLAAAVGVGQSMYQIKKYSDVNTMGTAKLLDRIVNGKIPIKKMIIASSMSIYGEGSYHCEDCGIVYPKLRPREQLEKREWEMKCPNCNKTVKPIQTNENKPLNPTSVYAVTKRDQEEMFLSVGNAYGIPTTALRYFNVYGTRQSLNNPYTGVCAIFSSRIKNNKSPIIFEDGLQTRDFISVHDIVNANLLVMSNPKADYEIFNIGTGLPVSIRQIADILINLYKSNVVPKIENRFRSGDIRHCFADISKIRKLGFEPKTPTEKGIKELVQWGEEVEAKDLVDLAISELKEKGLKVLESVILKPYEKDHAAIIVEKFAK